MEQKDIRYYDIPDFGRKISEDEARALLEMCASQGWKVFMDLRRIEAKAAVNAGMALSTTEEVRQMNRAVYHAMLNDLSFETRLSAGMDEHKPQKLEEHENIIEADDDVAMGF